LLGCEVSPPRSVGEDAWWGFRSEIEGNAWQLVAQSWETHPMELEKVGQEWRKMYRRGRAALGAVQARFRAQQKIAPGPLIRYIERISAGRFASMFAQRRRGRLSSLTWFDSIVLWFDSVFPGLECRVNYDRSTYRGRFPEIMIEIIRQIGPSIEGRVVAGLPTGVNVQATDDRSTQAAFNAIGRRIEELRIERRDREGRLRDLTGSP
jgi:hypothetical protein